MNTLIKLIIFDLDGTLINSIEDLAEATNYALSKNGYPTHEVYKFNHFVGDGVPTLIERVLPESARFDETILKVKADFSEYYNEHYSSKTKPYDGIQDLLKELMKKDIKLAVASNKPDDFSKAIVSLFFGEIFSYVQGNSPNIPKKPNPQIAISIMDKLNVSKSECLFVGDTNVDINTAKSAGIKSIGCLWGFRDLEELQVAQADYIISEPSEILKYI